MILYPMLHYIYVTLYLWGRTEDYKQAQAGVMA